MDKRKQNHMDPWEDGVYGTGNTHPPKSHGGIIALLLIIVIFLSGIVTLLSVMNIRLFHQLSLQEEEVAPLSFTADSHDGFEKSESGPANEDNGLVLSEMPKPEEVEPRETVPTWQELYDKTRSSVVSVTSRTYAGILDGAGIILNEQGYIITNYHLVEDAEAVTVSLVDQRCYSAAIVGADRVSDIAVLRIDAPDLVPAEFGDSSMLQIGDDIIAIVQGAGNSKIDSIVSGIDRSITIGGRKLSLIQTSSKLKREGLMLNRYGQIIGVHTRNLSAILNCGEDTCFFIPSIALKEIVDELITQGYVSGRPSLGVDGIFLSLFDQYYYNIPSGLYITSVIPGSSADTLGLRMGDVLISVNGEPISDSDTLNELLCSFRVGDGIYAIISRDNQLYQIELTIAEDRG